ncbi:MAG: hypothetical protein V1789_08455 [PVC group bacterium]
MIISKAVLWAILVGFFIFTAAAVYLVNENVRVEGKTAADAPAADVQDVW